MRSCLATLGLFLAVLIILVIIARAANFGGTQPSVAAPNIQPGQPGASPTVPVQGITVSGQTTYVVKDNATSINTIASLLCISASAIIAINPALANTPPDQALPIGTIVNIPSSSTASCPTSGTVTSQPPNSQPGTGRYSHP